MCIRDSRTKELESAALAARLAAEEIDVTLPGKAPAQGKRHPFEQVLGELKEIFLGMGFDIVSGPEVELDHYNFEMLNMPKSHPARDTQDKMCIRDRYYTICISQVQAFRRLFPVFSHFRRLMPARPAFSPAPAALPGS